MSRSKRLAHSLLSGYLLLGASVLYTLGSVPLALHYLSKEQFGLWAVVTQFSSFLLLVDLGMSGAVSRTLVDHKDNRLSTTYGSVIQTGFLVLLVQGTLMALGGVCLSYWLPGWMNVPEKYWPIFRLLAAGQCVIQAVSFIARIFSHILQAHQRFDISNYSQIGVLLIGFFGLWLGFQSGLGLYSMLLAALLGCVWMVVYLPVTTARLHLFPAKGAWGRPTVKIFKELFSFGSDLFLLSVGLQLSNASQVLILTRLMGLETATVWAIATKTFSLGQQFVGRIFDFSSSALSEMIVRGEQEQLRKRFKDILILTASISVLMGGALALCNSAFVQLWTSHRVAWNSTNDLLLGFLLISTSVTRCHIGLTGLTKQLGAMRFIYFLEGVSFVIAGVLVVPRFGIMGLLVCAVSANLIWSGVYGCIRTAGYFRLKPKEIADDWLAPSRNYFLILILVVAAGAFCSARLSPASKLLLNAAFIASFGTVLLWQFGLTDELRAELRIAGARVLAKLRQQR